MYSKIRGINPGGSRLPDFGQEGRGSREIFINLFMYRKYVRKWWLLKRNRIICPEVAVNGQFFSWKINILLKLPEKVDIFRKFACKNQNFCVKLPEKIKIFRKFAWEFFFTRIHDPQISNQIDAAEKNWSISGYTYLTYYHEQYNKCIWKVVFVCIFIIIINATTWHQSRPTVVVNEEVDSGASSTCKAWCINASLSKYGGSKKS